MTSDFGACFETAEYASIQVPTYPAGQIGAFLARKSGGTGLPSCRQPRRPVPDGMDLRYYSPEMHAAAFAVPAFLQRRLQSAAPQAGAQPATKRQRLHWTS